MANQTSKSVGDVAHTAAGTFARDVLSSETPTVVDFYADWCAPCRMVAPLMEQLAHELAGKVRFVKVNVDEEGELARHYGVMSIPTIVFFKGGREAGRIIGAAPKEHLKHEMHRYLLDEGR